MPVMKDAIVSRLAVERGYLTQEQADKALAAQKVGAEATGVTVALSQILVGKGLLSPDQAQELANAVAVKTGEARLIAGYEVVSKLGQGGMGAVYKARSLQTGEYVALKILPPSLADEDTVARFSRESKAVKDLDHENIVGYVEFGYDERRKCYPGFPR